MGWRWWWWWGGDWKVGVRTGGGGGLEGVVDGGGGGGGGGKRGEGKMGGWSEWEMVAGWQGKWEERWLGQIRGRW